MRNGFVNAGAKLPATRFASRRSPGWLSIALVVALPCCLVIGAMALRKDKYYRSSNADFNDSRGPAKVASEPIAKGATPTLQPTQHIEAEVITIRSTGFEPSEITRPKGPFVLAIENRSGLQAMQLRLDSVGVARLLDFQMPKTKHDWNDRLDLPPGKYVLSDAYHPDWACSITITAK